MSGSVGTSPVVTTLTVAGMPDLQRDLTAAANLLNGYVRANESASRALAATGQQATQAGNAFTGFGRVMGQAGYQVQDFAVQVQAGTSALTALSQQGSQFLGVFGTGGAIAGAVLTVGILAAQLIGLADATDKAAKAQKELEDRLDAGSTVLETAADRTLRLANARLEDARAAGQQLAGEIIRDIERANRLANDIARETALLSRTGNPLDQGIIVQNNVRLQQENERFRLLQRRLEEAEGKLAQIPASATPPVEVTAQRGGRGRGGAERTPQDVLDGRALQASFDAFFDRADDRAEEKISRFENDVRRAAAATDDLAGVGREFATVFTSAFDGLTTKAKSFSDVLSNLGLGIAKILERQFITKPLESGLSELLKGQTLSGLFTSASNFIFGPPRAEGGPVMAGAAYLVGEKGPEMFVPNVSGQIVPNGAGGGIFIDARGAEQGVEARIDAVLARRLPAIMAATRGDLAARVNRGGADARTFGRR